MKPAMSILLMLLLIGGHNLCRADTSDSITEIKETENWTMAYLMKHPEEKKKTAELTEAIEQGAIKTEDVEYYKNKPAGLRSFIATVILRLNAKLFLPLVTHEKQEWLCDSLIENSQTDGWYYPVLTFSPKYQNMDAILDYCITKNKVGKWNAFVSYVEPNVNDSVKPVFDKIRSVIAALKAGNKLEQ